MIQLSEIKYIHLEILSLCIKWFNAVEESWAKSSFEEGKLVCCSDNCGSNK